MADRPYLFHFFGPGPIPETFKFKVFTLYGPEPFDVHAYRVDTGYLILYSEQPVENNGVRASPIAVFAPGGWLGYAIDLSDQQKLSPHLGFEFTKGED